MEEMDHERRGKRGGGKDSEEVERLIFSKSSVSNSPGTPLKPCAKKKKKATRIFSPFFFFFLKSIIFFVQAEEEEEEAKAS